MKTILTAAFVALFGTSAIAQTASDPNCTDDFSLVISGLQKGYQEVPFGHGIGADGRLYSMFVNPQTGTWTVVTTTPAGITCMELSGRNWEFLHAPPNA